MQRLKRAIKKMAAIGTGVAMLGATMTGAIAADLADYPAPFVGASGVFDASTAIVVGDAAAASDTLGAVDIATNLQFMAKTPVTAGAGTVQVSGGVTEDIPIDRGIANSTTYALDWHMDDADIDSFMDTTVHFQGKDYDVHDELVLRKETPSVETSLTSSEDDYEEGVYLEVLKKGIYYFIFSDDGDLNISDATSSEPLEVKFLGKTLKITDAALQSGATTVQDRFTAYVGTEYFMDVGDTVTVDGKKVTLGDVGSGGSVKMDVDGTIDVVPAASTKKINGIEVTVDETFYASKKESRSASLIVGEDAEATYRDGDAYIGEDEDDPDWEWTIGNLALEAVTVVNTTAPDYNTILIAQGPYIGIYNDFAADGSEDDKLAGIGECYDLPNNYASICLDSLTVSEDDYLTLEIYFDDAVDLEDTGYVPNTGSMTSNEKCVVVETSVKDTLRIPANALDHENDTLQASDQYTDKIWLRFEAAGAAACTTNVTNIFYYDSDHSPNKIRYAGNVTHAGNSPKTGESFAQIYYKDTKDNNINLTIFNTTQDIINVALDILGDSTSELDEDKDDIIMNFTLASGAFNKLGDEISKAESDEITWNFKAGETTIIGEKDENHRSIYGVIIKDPKSNGANNRIVFEIPGDQVQANIVVKGQAATVAGGATSYIPADITIDTKLSSEVAGAETAHQLILVGGPCANPTVEAVSSLGTTCSGWTMGAGEAILKMASNGNKVALLIAGTDAIDTRMAAKVVANYEDYDLSGGSVVVTGSLSSPSLRVA